MNSARSWAMNAPSTAVSASARWKKNSRGPVVLAEGRDERAGHPGDRGQHDHEQVEPVDAELVADAELGDPLVVGHVLEPAAGVEVGEQRRSRRRAPRRVPASTAQRASPRGRNAPSSPAASGRKRMIDRWIVTSWRSGSRGRARRRRAAAAARRRAGSRSGSARANEVPARTMPVAPPTMKPCTKSVSITRRPKRAGGRDRPHEDGVVELVEVPLVDEEVVHARGSGRAARA